MFVLRDNLLKEKAEARDEKKRLEDEKVIRNTYNKISLFDF